MPELALDFAFARPDAGLLNAVGCRVILVYTGSGRPTQNYVRETVAAGIGVCFIQESTPDRSWTGGYAAGVADARFADGRADEYGYPDNAVIYYAVSDNNASVPGPAQAPAIAEYARGVGDTTRRPAFGAYGNRIAVDAAKQGHGKCNRSWVPSTWGANHSDVLWQMANIPAPIDATDTNHIVHEVADLGAWFLNMEEDMTKDEYDYLAKGIYLLTDGAQSTAGRVAALQAEVEALKAQIAALPASQGGAQSFKFTGNATTA